MTLLYSYTQGDWANSSRTVSALIFRSIAALSSGMGHPKHNTQVLIYDPEGLAIGLDAAHYEMLAELHGPASAPTELFLRAVLAKSHFERAIPLLVFIDCLVLLQFLQKWGRSDFWPDQRDIIHFDVNYPLLQELHQWNAPLKLVKVKSHAGCKLNEMAYELADQGCASDEEPVKVKSHADCQLNEMAYELADQGCASDEELVLPGQQKYGSLLLRVRM